MPPRGPTVMEPRRITVPLLGPWNLHFGSGAKNKVQILSGTCKVLSRASFSLFTCKFERSSCWEIVGLWKEVMYVKCSTQSDTGKVRRDGSTAVLLTALGDGFWKHQLTESVKETRQRPLFASWACRVSHVRVLLLL